MIDQEDIKRRNKADICAYERENECERVSMNIAVFYALCVFVRSNFLTLPSIFCNLLTESFSLSDYNHLHTVFCP